MKLVELSDQDKDRYNRFVMENETGSFLQSWEWGQWQASLGRQSYRFALVEERGNWVAVMQILKHKLSKKSYYLYAPYGPIVDFRFKIEDFRFIVQELHAKFLEAVFVRLEPKMEIPNLALTVKKTTHIQPVSTLILDLTKPVEQLGKEMHPKTRYNIRLAQRHGVEIKSDLAIVPKHGLYLKEAVDLIITTAKRQGFKTYEAGYYQQLLDFFGTRNHGSDLKVYVYRALLERKLLAAAIMVDFGRTRTYLFGGSSASRREVMAPHLLHFIALSDAKESGLKNYDFWGLDTSREKNPGFARFKLGFGGKRLEYPGAYDYVFNRGQYLLYRSLRQVNRFRQRLKT